MVLTGEVGQPRAENEVRETSHRTDRLRLPQLVRNKPTTAEARRQADSWKWPLISWTLFSSLEAIYEFVHVILSPPNALVHHVWKSGSDGAGPSIRLSHYESSGRYFSQMNHGRYPS